MPHSARALLVLKNVHMKFETIDDLLRQKPDCEPVLARHGIDTCCGRSDTVTGACRRAGLSVDVLLAAVELESDRVSAPDVTSEPEEIGVAPLTEIIQHILRTYHAPVGPALRDIEVLLDRVNDAHSGTHGGLIDRVRKVIATLAGELSQHMAKEEYVLFPMIFSGRGALAEAPIRLMCQEHDDTHRILDELRELNQLLPWDTCETWRRLASRLRWIDTNLREHMRVEEEVLFPRALAGK